MQANFSTGGFGKELNIKNGKIGVCQEKEDCYFFPWCEIVGVCLDDTPSVEINWDRFDSYVKNARIASYVVPHGVESKIGCIPTGKPLPLSES